MKRYICIFVLLILVNNFCFSGQSAWSDAMYDNYNYNSFAQFPAAVERIDFDNIDYALLHAAIFFETNKRRVENNRSPFDHSIALEKAATGHSRDMVRYNFFSHTSIISGKISVVDRLALVGITNCYTAENISYTFGLEYEGGKNVYSPEQNGGYFSYSYKGDPILSHSYLSLARTALDTWMDSTGHRRNILNKNYIYLGAGTAHYKKETFYNMDYFKLTQNFSSFSPD